MTKDALFSEYLAIVRQHGLYAGRRTGIRTYLDYLFEGVSFKGKAMLDVGGGSGLFSLYAACMGAQPVICLEPALHGSRKDTLHELQMVCESLPSRMSVISRAVTFQEFQSGNRTFDIILLHNSINHLDEEACVSLRYDHSARKRYQMIFEKLSELLRRGGTLIIADCSRHNLWRQINVRSPLAPTIEWHKHQSPRYWSTLLSDSGFVCHKIRWASPSGLGRTGRLLFGNSVAAYLTTSHFCLVMHRR